MGDPKKMYARIVSLVGAAGYRTSGKQPRHVRRIAAAMFSAPLAAVNMEDLLEYIENLGSKERGIRGRAFMARLPREDPNHLTDVPIKPYEELLHQVIMAVIEDGQIGLLYDLPDVLAYLESWRADNYFENFPRPVRCDPDAQQSMGEK